MPNRLAGESSPYLLQHANNPVDWYPWGEEALQKARAEDKPILLSIGYSACHWCHVMEHESFEDPSIAELMNRWFVSIKVDREERPDLDAIYMQAVQALTQQGGWPMTVFLTPEGAPFWAGTYFPPEDRQGMPGFKRVLMAMADVWRTRRGEVTAQSEQLRAQLQGTLRPSTGVLEADLLSQASAGILTQYDPREGGFGTAPKFPQPMAVEFLLRAWRRSEDERARAAAEHTLERMARGGMYDQLGGGFHRYSTDAHWLVPHFEKMLYDNAQLARAYLMGYQVSGNAFFRDTAEQTLRYVLRDLSDPGGGFYSTEDADSEGVEGKFYVWTPSQVAELLGERDARLFCAFYDVTARGNFEHGTSILHMPRTPEEVAQQLGVSDVEVLSAVERGRQVLFEAREQRVRPGRDEKVLTAWNGMFLRALAEAASVLGQDEFRAAAVRNAEFLLGTMRRPDGRLFRTWKPGHSAKLNGYLEDYANLADGLVALYEATFERRWLSAAVELADIMLERFVDRENGGFFDTADDHESLIARPKDVFDNATPAGNSVAADVLLRLALLLDRSDYRMAAERVFLLLRAALVRYPLGFARALSGLDLYLGAPKEIAIIGAPGSADTQALLRTVFEPFLPNKVVAGGDDTTGIPLLEQRGQLDGHATAYVCQNYTCQQPVTSPDALRDQLMARS
jgi:uncharacterized protein YyaL (SSP411 family)